jgi:hypothetical protein
MAEFADIAVGTIATLKVDTGLFVFRHVSWRLPGFGVVCVTE